MNYYPNYPTYRLYFGEVKTINSMNKNVVSRRRRTSSTTTAGGTERRHSNFQYNRDDEKVDCWDDKFINFIYIYKFKTILLALWNGEYWDYEMVRIGTIKFNHIGTIMTILGRWKCEYWDNDKMNIGKMKCWILGRSK